MLIDTTKVAVMKVVRSKFVKHFKLSIEHSDLSIEHLKPVNRVNLYFIPITMNKMHVCERCGYTTAFAANLKRHAARKKPCPTLVIDPPVDKVANPLYCSGCKRVFKTPACLRQHGPVCKGVDALTCVGCKKSFGSLAAKHCHRWRGKCVAPDATDVSEAAQLNVANQTIIGNQINNVTNNTTNHVTNHVTINQFGNEDISFLLNDPQFWALVERKQSPDDDMMSASAVSATTLCIYFDPDHPENHTIRPRNHKTGMVWINGSHTEDARWATEKVEPAIDKMMMKSTRVLNHRSGFANLRPMCSDTRKLARSKIGVHVLNAGCLRDGSVPPMGTKPQQQTITAPGALVPYGEEDFSYITAAEMDAAIGSCSAAAELVRLRHRHPDHPENANVRISAIDTGLRTVSVFEVWTGEDGWRRVESVESVEASVSRLAEGAFRALAEHAESGECQCRSGTRSDFDFLMDEYLTASRREDTWMKFRAADTKRHVEERVRDVLRADPCEL